jgi:hypothetical protein
MKGFAITFGAAIAVLGLWIVGIAFFKDHEPVEPLRTRPDQTLETVGETPGAQLAVGFALLGGGIFLIYLTSRK